LPLVIQTNALLTAKPGSGLTVQQMSKAYLEAQAAMAQYSTRSLVVPCNSCGVMPPITAPQEVINAINQVQAAGEP
jgi:predicted RNA polymerase sigma factor